MKIKLQNLQLSCKCFAKYSSSPVQMVVILCLYTSCAIEKSQLFILSVQTHTILKNQFLLTIFYMSQLVKFFNCLHYVFFTTILIILYYLHLWRYIYFLQRMHINFQETKMSSVHKTRKHSYKGLTMSLDHL